jgi:hypothetical protein
MRYHGTDNFETSIVQPYFCYPMGNRKMSKYRLGSATARRVPAAPDVRG